MADDSGPGSGEDGSGRDVPEPDDRGAPDDGPIPPSGGSDASEPGDSDGSDDADPSGDDTVPPDHVGSPTSGTPEDDAAPSPPDHRSPSERGAGGSGAPRSPSEQRSDGGVSVDDPDPYAPGGEAPAAPDDEEMPLGEHIEEMVSRLAVVILAMAVVSAPVFLVADRLINFLWYSFMPGSVSQCPVTGQEGVACPYVYHPLALIFARLKVATLVGFVFSLPVLVYESYLFMRPGLYPRERKYYLASVPTSLVLAGVGVAFAYFLVLPALFIYFTGYTAQAADAAFGLTETFNLIVMMLGFFALIFQIPLFIMLAIMMGVTSRRWLADRRIYFWGGFATIAFLFSPDPTGMAPIMVAVTMIVLFEGTLLLLYWTGDASPIPTAEGLTARRPFAWLAFAIAGYLASPAPVPGGYYGDLPAAVTDALTEFGLARGTPLLVGGLLIALYEATVYGYRKLGTNLQVYRTLRRARPLVWPVSLLIGYFGSPDPTLLEYVDEFALPVEYAAGLAVGLIVLYEAVILLLRWREDDEDEHVDVPDHEGPP